MSTPVTLVIPQLLQPLVAGQRQLSLGVDEQGATVAELLDVVGSSYPVFNRRVRDETGALRRFVNVYLNGDDVRRLDGLQTRAAPGAEVLVLQSVAGG